MYKTVSTALYWDQLTSEEINTLASQGLDLAILPVGATEQHGPHMVCGADTLEARRLAEEVSQLTGVPILPPLPYGCSYGHSKKWAGTLSLSPKLLIDTIVSIYEWLNASGFKRLLLLNGHATNQAPLRCALEMIRYQWADASIGQHFIGDLSPRVREQFERDAKDWHANRAETSLMFALNPAGLRPDKILLADDPDRTVGNPFAFPVDRTSLNGVTGSPSLANLNEGQSLWSWMVEDYENIVRSALKSEPLI